MLAQYIYRVMKWTDQIDLNYKFSFSRIFYQKYHFTSSQFVLSIHHIDIHSTRAVIKYPQIMEDLVTHSTKISI